MTDRKPGAPGQYKAVITAAELQKMQTGEQFTITMTRDDRPIVEGTPYSKAAVLPDELAALICPDVEDPAPADAFAGLQDKKVGVDDVIDIAHGGHGGTTVAEAQAGLLLTKSQIFNQTGTDGAIKTSAISAYPTSPGIYRVNTGSATIGVPANYGCLVIFSGGNGYYMHLYIGSGGAFYIGRTTSMTAPTWTELATAADLDALTG